MGPFLLALQFLTRFPVPAPRVVQPSDLGQATLFYPLVGLVIGCSLATLGVVLRDSPSGLAAAVVVAAWVVITGALHLDGLADSADAWVGGHGDRERTLAIMKDPYVGPVGATLLVLLLLLKFAALDALLEQGVLVAVILAPFMGRLVLPLLFLTTCYVRPGGLGEAPAYHMPRVAAKWVIVGGVLAVLLVGAMSGFWMVIASILVFACLRALMQRRLGGTTGDTAGALVEVTEAACLFAATLAL